VLFDVIPTFVDIAVALVVFAFRLDLTLAAVIFFVVLAYGAFRLSPPIFAHTQSYLVVVSVVLTRWRTRLRRSMNDRDAVRNYQLPSIRSS
jgi:ABC-type transport system involved in Fe-S cluster assembly fused permease/ATPase subunit